MLHWQRVRARTPRRTRHPRCGAVRPVRPVRPTRDSGTARRGPEDRPKSWARFGLVVLESSVGLRQWILSEIRRWGARSTR